ncbi:PREDICTED: UBN2_3 domain-containing [Prunus dulcis]|uniref:PREDICTED: UBN2_3 domain-containing n=1 Tax=Prunus dulcis TaxID=3755 RepID=A0A5E4FIT1_PRUDU|nr:PREDICTED: UBN2_3 domain-containing [Prunus dulcis]
MSSSTTTSSTVAAMATYSLPNITHLVTVKLNDDNYLLWYHQVEAFLVGQDLFKYVDGTHLCPAASSPDYNHWVRTDKTLVSTLSATLSEPILASVVGCKTSATMWSLISKYFTQNSTANSSHLRRCLNEISRGTRFVSDYLQEAKSISDQLAFIGEPVSNTDLVNVVLQGLGDEYKMLVTALESLDTLPDFSALRSCLLTQESRSTYHFLSAGCVACLPGYLPAFLLKF